MSENKPSAIELQEGVDLHPRHESWVRITTNNSFIGFMIFIALAATFVILINSRFNPVALAAIGVLAFLILIWFVWRRSSKHRRGFPGNAGLTFRIKADLITELGASDINVDSSKGVVTLHGTVPHADFRVAAEDLARRRGAHQVINELKVVSLIPDQQASYLQGIPGLSTPEGAPGVATHMSLEETVREALEDDARVDAYVMIVNVQNGIAYLTGRQETVQASDAATEVAAHVSGILGVANDMEITPSI